MTRSRTRAQTAMEWEPLVRIYESRLWRRSGYFAAMTGISFDEECERILRAARLEGAERVLDLACGSGIYTRPLARRVERGFVVGLDLSPAMLAYAARRARAERLGNLALVRGSALALPFPDARFDVVSCCGALHLFPDVDAALREIARVQVPGARLTLAVFRETGGALGAWRARVRRRWAGVDSFTRSDLQRRLEAAGFEGFEQLHEAGVWMVAAARKPTPAHAS